MRTEQHQTIEISQQALSWLLSKYDAVDRTDGNLYRTFLANDCRLLFGNNPPVTGRDEIITGIEHFWSAIKGLEHNLLAVLGNDFHFTMETVIDYTRLDGNVVTIPCITSIERNPAGLAKSIKIFIDTAPIFATIDS